MDLEEPLTVTQWKNRRRTIRLSLLFCAFVIIYCVMTKNPSEVHKIAVEWSFITGTMLVLGYTGLAVWDDKNVMSILGTRQNRHASRSYVPPTRRFNKDVEDMED